jgi:hypothetical protein
MGGVFAKVFFLYCNGKIDLLKWSNEFNTSMFEVLYWTNKSGWLGGEEDTWKELFFDFL